LTADTDFQSVLDAVGLTAIVKASQPVVDKNDSDSGSSSSSDEINKAKRARLDPDYVPSTASTSPLTTAGPSQEASEDEAELDAEPTESDTDDTESWNPSGTTSPEVYSTPEDD
jgi:hypothetical protein